MSTDTQGTWKDGWGCNYCCNGDRCDNPMHIDRKSCSHCQGTGWALWNLQAKRRELAPATQALEAERAMHAQTQQFRQEAIDKFHAERKAREDAEERWEDYKKNFHIIKDALGVAERDAARGRFMLKNAQWYRREGKTYIEIQVADGADLSCLAMRENAIDTAIESAQGKVKCSLNQSTPLTDRRPEPSPVAGAIAAEKEHG